MKRKILVALLLMASAAMWVGCKTNRFIISSKQDTTKWSSHYNGIDTLHPCFIANDTIDFFVGYGTGKNRSVAFVQKIALQKAKTALAKEVKKYLKEECGEAKRYSFLMPSITQTCDKLMRSEDGSFFISYCGVKIKKEEIEKILYSVEVEF